MEVLPESEILNEMLVKACTPERHDARQKADEDVRVDAALVSLVDDDDAVLGQQEIALNLF